MNLDDGLDLDRYEVEGRATHNEMKPLDRNNENPGMDGWMVARMSVCPHHARIPLSVAEKAQVVLELCLSFSRQVAECSLVLQCQCIFWSSQTMVRSNDTLW